MSSNLQYWSVVWLQFKKNKIGMIALWTLILFALVGLYAPLLASSKPLVVYWEGKLYFPLFRYLFYPGFYSKPIDLFYNVLMLTAPIAILGLWLLPKGKKTFLMCLGVIQVGLFLLFAFGTVKDPASEATLLTARKETMTKHLSYREDPLLASFHLAPTWPFELKYMTPYAKLNLLLRYTQRKEQHARFERFEENYRAEKGEAMPTLWNIDQKNQADEIRRLKETLALLETKYADAREKLADLTAAYRPYSHNFLMARYELQEAERHLHTVKNFPRSEEYAHAEKQLALAQTHYQNVIQNAAPARVPLERARSVIQKYQDAAGKLAFLAERETWLKTHSSKLRVLMPTFVRPFHWEDDAGGGQSINKYLPWWELTRLNRKDLVASLIFGVRISLVIGFTAVALSIIIGIPLGTIAGYFAGKTDIVICRLIEIWEAMPTFFMLLLVVAVTQSKSIFLVIAVLGIFGWTGFGRFIRGEVLKQRHLPYVQACHSLGYRHPKIMFSHIMPNAIPPILTLLPFSMMAAITSEAGLSFLGLGEESSPSWGVLMDEGRSVFPGESYLLWPPAILLTALLVSIALVGDALRDAMDPKMRR